MSKEEWRTAWEHTQELKKDPEWVAMIAEKYAKAEAIVAKARAEEELMVADIRRAGYPVKDSVYELVNTTDSYPEVIPVLINHLRRPYSNGTIEGIVRALSVNEARGIAGPAVLEVFRRSQDNSPGCRWAMIYSLTTVADMADKDAIVELIKEEKDKDVLDQLKRALKKAMKRPVKA